MALDSVRQLWAALGGIGRRLMAFDGIVRRYTVLYGVGWCWMALDGVRQRWRALDCPQPMQTQTQQQSSSMMPRRVAYNVRKLVNAASSGTVPDKELPSSLLHVQ